MAQPRLSKDLVLSSDYQKRKDVEVPEADVFEFPEKILQFGSGRFLRGFADFFIDKAIRQGLFDGRVVVCKARARGAATSSTGRTAFTPSPCRASRTASPSRPTR